jgi:hypothetical protein
MYGATLALRELIKHQQAIFDGWVIPHITTDCERCRREIHDDFLLWLHDYHTTYSWSRANGAVNAYIKHLNTGAGL